MPDARLQDSIPEDTGQRLAVESFLALKELVRATSKSMPADLEGWRDFAFEVIIHNNAVMDAVTTYTPETNTNLPVEPEEQQ